MIGDRSHDVAGARACGVLAVGALWGYGTQAELTAAGAHALAETPAHAAAALSEARTRDAASSSPLRESGPRFRAL
jgi:phosphoglycolate phosphatase-like HAD superfamily hydrolase